MRELKDILKQAADRNASDIHISMGDPVMLRTDGRLGKLDETVPSAQDFGQILKTYLSAEQLLALKQTGAVSLVIPLGQEGRFRLFFYRKTGGYAIAGRHFPAEIPFFDELRLPEGLRTLLKKPSGLILAGGGAGSGRSTSLAAIINELNMTTEKYIVVLSELAEFCHRSIRSLVEQRGIGSDVASAGAGIRAAVSADADIIVLDEIHDAETLGEAIFAAQAGKLLIAGIRAEDTTAVYKRLLEFYEPDRRAEISEKLSAYVQGILAQKLLPLKKGGRAAACELLIFDQAVRNLLKEEKYGQVLSIMQNDKKNGMVTFDGAMAEMESMRLIAGEE